MGGGESQAEAAATCTICLVAGLSLGLTAASRAPCFSALRGCLINEQEAQIRQVDVRTVVCSSFLKCRPHASKLREATEVQIIGPQALLTELEFAN